VRYFLSSFRAPNPPNRSEPGKPLGLQAKDYLRKRLIGKTVSVHPEYTRISNDKPMHFASVFLDDQNIALEMTELGLG
jgi:endonuclease YncB( thermonuclease family)